MTDEQKDAVIGRVMRESKENDEAIGRLNAEAHRLGERLNAVGRGLVAHPEGVHLGTMGIDIRYTNYRVGFDASDFDLQKLVALTNDYRAALQKRDTLDNQLTQLGFPPSRGR
jgi:hypothetical protein